MRLPVALLALALVLGGCAPGTGALLSCLAFDHDINRKCQ